MRKQRFKQSTAGTIVYSPREGPPNSGETNTVALFTPGNETLQAATAATVSAISTTTTASISKGAVSVAVADRTDCVAGDKVWVGTVGSEISELMQIESITAGVGDAGTLYFTEGFRMDHASGTAVKGSTISYTLTTTHTATLDENYRALWTYTVGSTQYSDGQLFDVVKQVFRLPLTPADLVPRIPEQIRRAARGLNAMDDLIEAAEDDIIREFKRRRLRADLDHNPDAFRNAGILACMNILLTRHAMADSAFREARDDARKEYNAEIGAVFGDLDWYDINEDLSVDTADEDTGEGGEEHAAGPRYLRWA